MLSAPDDDSRPSGIKGSWGIVVFLSIAFLPAFIIGWGYYAMLRFFRQKFSVIFSTVLIVDIIMIMAWFQTGAWDKVKTVFANLENISNNWVELLPAVIVFNIIMGGFFGLVLTFVQIKQIKSNPHKTKLKGSWLYQFEFRRTPLQILRRKKNIEGLKSGKFTSGNKAPLGIDEENDDKIAYRYNSEAVKPTLISGAAGSGKTITMLSMIKNDIEGGLPVVAIDFKRDPELASKMSIWAKENGRNFYHFVNGDPEKYDIPESPGQAFYDPLINGGASKADMVLGMREYDKAATVWKDAMRQLLQVLFAMFRHADKKDAPDIDWAHGGIYQIASSITGSNFTHLVEACIGTSIQDNAEEVEMGLRTKGSNLSRAMSELQGNMRTMIVSEYGRWLKTSKARRNIDLFELTKTGKDSVILFSLNSDSEKDFSHLMGSLILSDLNAVSAKRRNLGMKNQINIYVDEFQAVAPTSITSLLEKSRGSGMAMTISSQSYEQIISSSESNGEAYLLGILDTCSNFIVHNGATETSATRLSQILGKRYETVYSAANQNEGFLFSINFFNKRNQTVQAREEERWVIHPRTFMSLSSPVPSNNYKSTAVVIKKASDDPLFQNPDGGATARTIWMIPDESVITEYYNPIYSDEEDYNDDEETATMVSELTSSQLAENLEELSINEDMEAPIDYMSERLDQNYNGTDYIDEAFGDYYETDYGRNQDNSYEHSGNENYSDSDNYIDEDEMVDGDFGWEVVEDEEVSSIDWDNAAPTPAKPKTLKEEDILGPKQKRIVKSALEPSSFEIFSKNKEFKPEKLADREPKKKEVEKNSRSNGLPLGLIQQQIEKSPPVVSKTANYDSDDELPDLEDLM